MKMKLLKVVAGFLFLPVFMQSGNEDSAKKTLYVIEISSSMTVKGIPTSNYEVLISHDGKILDTITVTKAKPVYFDLEQEEVFSLIFRKKGYDDKIVMIDTHVDNRDKKKRYFSFEFDVEVDSKTSTQKYEYKDFPVAYVKYFHNEKEFNVSRKYHSEIHKGQATASAWHN